MTVAHSLYEQGMASLTDDLERIVKILDATGIVYEVIGGVAVNAHLMQHHRSRSFVTRNVDLLIRREDLAVVVEAALAAGGRIIDQTSAPEAWILADQAGNRVCVAAWPDAPRFGSFTCVV